MSGPAFRFKPEYESEGRHSSLLSRETLAFLGCLCPCFWSISLRSKFRTKAIEPSRRATVITLGDFPLLGTQEIRQVGRLRVLARRCASDGLGFNWLGGVWTWLRAAAPPETNSTSPSFPRWFPNVEPKLKAHFYCKAKPVTRAGLWGLWQ